MDKIKTAARMITFSLLVLSVFGAFLAFVGNPTGQQPLLAVFAQISIFLIAIVMTWLAYWLTKAIGYHNKTFLFIIFLVILFLTVIPLARLLIILFF